MWNCTFLHMAQQTLYPKATVLLMFFSSCPCIHADFLFGRTWVVSHPADDRGTRAGTSRFPPNTMPAANAQVKYSCLRHKTPFNQSISRSPLFILLYKINILLCVVSECCILLRKILQYKPEYRLSLEEILSDRWLSDDDTRPPMRRFSKPRWVVRTYWQSRFFFHKARKRSLAPLILLSTAHLVRR